MALDVRNVALLLTVVVQRHHEQRIEETVRVGHWSLLLLALLLLPLTQVANITRHTAHVDLAVFNQLTGSTDRKEKERRLRYEIQRPVAILSSEKSCLEIRLQLCFHARVSPSKFVQ